MLAHVARFIHSKSHVENLKSMFKQLEKGH